nr:CAunnamed protein product [Biomphalaria glabrata]
MCRRVHELLAPLLCVCVYCLRLLSETEALLASRVSNDTSNERFIFIDESESIRTHTDSQFVKAYTNFKTSKYPEIFIPIAIACLFFGALGNIGFFALFGNKLKRAYYTRDSLYFRFLATLDILVCLIVLPYAMFFEAERVTNNYVCKSMEYVRHFLTYMAHLGLLSYSFELPLRQGYTASKNHVRRAAYGIVILSAFCSIPVVFLFEINPIAFNNTLTPVIHKRHAGFEHAEVKTIYDTSKLKSCHMTFNFQPNGKYHDLLEYAKKMYYGINTLLYSAGLLLYVYKVILFIDARPLLGQDSLFIQNVIDVREHSFSMPSPELASKPDKRKQSTTNPVYLKNKTDDEMTDVTDDAASTKSADAKAKTSSKDADPSNEGVRKVESDSSTRSQNNNLDRPEAGRERKVSFGDAMIDSVSYNPDDAVRSIQKSEWNQPSRPILKSNERSSLKISSYKKSMMFLIFLDLLIITVTVIVDLAVKNSSTALNFIHTKCVLSFYLISLTNKELRTATWGRYFECCKNWPSGYVRTTTSSTGIEFFGSNVRPELMRAWGRYSYEASNSDLTETSNVSGVSDIPAPVLLSDRPTVTASTRTSVMTK